MELELGKTYINERNQEVKINKICQTLKDDESVEWTCRGLYLGNFLPGYPGAGYYELDGTHISKYPVNLVREKE